MDIRLCGFDFGNCAMRMCVYRNNEPIAVTLNQGSFSVPSVITIYGDDSIYGSEAITLAPFDNSKVVCDLLRWVRSNHILPGNAGDSHSVIPSRTPVRVGNDCYFDLGGERHLPMKRAISDMISYGILSARSFLQYGDIQHLSLSIPVYYSYSIFETIYSALEEKGISSSFYWEPEAVVLAHLYKSIGQIYVMPRYFLVCSFGNIFLSLSVVSATQDISIKSTMKDENLGGNNVTKMIRKWLERRIKSLYPRANFRPLSYIQKEAENIKRSIYDYEEDTIEVDLRSLLVDDGAANGMASAAATVNEPFIINVSKKDLNDVFEKVVGDTMKMIKEAMISILPKTTCIDEHDIHLIICGNEARSPFLHRKIDDTYDSVTWYDNDESISSCGACLCYAHNRIGIFKLAQYQVKEISKDTVNFMRGHFGSGICDKAVRDHREANFLKLYYKYKYSHKFCVC